MVLKSNSVNEVDAEQAVATLLHYITGRDPNLPGHELEETPARVVRSFEELFAGYNANPNEIFKWFLNPFHGPIVFRDIEFWSTCEHHMLPFTGTVDLAYWAKDEVLGASKATRLVDMFARRLQTQETMAWSIAQTLLDHGYDHGVRAVVCRTRGRHECMSSRGVNKPALMEVDAAIGEEYLIDILGRIIRSPGGTT